MTGILSLWLPIIVSAVLVFIVSSIIHMVLGYHRKDWEGVGAEDAVRSALRPLAIPPGDYMVPHCTSPKDADSPEYKAKLEEGPVLLMTVIPSGPFTMGAALGQWFAFCVFVAGFAGWVAGRTLAPGTEYMPVFCIVAAVAFAGFGLAQVQSSIWYRRKWSTTFKNLFDALVYGLVTGGTFGWLWPGA